MNVNATLIVQAFHFLIAYQILKHLILKPLLKVMAHDEQEQASVLQRLKDEERIYQEAVQQKKNDWDSLKQEFISKAPEIALPEKETIHTIAPTTFIPQDELQNIVHDVAKTITDTVKRGD